jgi:DNA-binding winged helix-turn-helix (wHTH) protein/TolB-like protein
MATGEVFRIGEATLDLERGTLAVAGELVPVRSKTFALLSHFVRNHGRVLTKDELFETIWPGVIVTDDSLTQCVRDARKAIRDDEQKVIRTIPKRGYLLAGDMEPNPASRPLGKMLPVSPMRLAEPVVAVLPFSIEAIAGDEAAAVQSFNEELADAISRFRSVAVIAPASTRKFDSLADPVEAGRILNADYCVRGIIAAGGEVAINVELVEITTGRRIWADEVTSVASRLLETPDLVATRIVGQLVGSVEADAARRAQRAPTDSLQAYAHMIRGIALLRQYGEGVNEAGKVELEKAARIDPDSGLVQAYIALAEAMISRGQSGVRSTLHGARDRALRACALAPNEARCHRVLAIVLTYLHEFAAAEAQYERALQINPYDADTLAQYGFMRAMRGHPLEALELMDRAVQLNPFHSDWYYCDRHAPLFMLGRYQESAQVLERLPLLKARHSAYVAASYAMDGQHEKAAKHLADAYRKDPGLKLDELVEFMEWERREDRALLARGLAIAAELLADRQAIKP